MTYEYLETGYWGRKEIRIEDNRNFKIAENMMFYKKRRLIPLKK